MSGTVTAPKSPPKPPLKERIQQLMVEYGSLALWVYFGIFAIVITGFWLAIKLGIKTDSAAGTAGTIGAAWVATKLTQPIRIVATLALTPAVMRGLRWLKTRGRPPEANTEAPTDVTPT
jgi:hypothetical protein